VSHEFSTVWRQLGWRLTAFAYDALAAVLRVLPVDAVSAAGAAIVSVLGPRTSKHRIVLRNLELAFPEKSRAEREAIARDYWARIGRTFAEFPLMDRITPATGRVEVVGLERLQALARDKVPAVLVSGHLSNWETMMAVIVHSGLDCRVSYRPANNPYMDQRIIEGRRSYGVRLEAAKGGEGTRGLIAALSKGGSVALLNDQRDNGGVEAPFFGRQVRTAPGPARLALKFGRRLIPMSVVRTKGARFVVTIHEPMTLEDTGDKARDLQATVAQINAFIEDCLRARPAEWLWAHRRWPLEYYAREARAEPQPVPVSMSEASPDRRQGPS
jgi:KDO2-lipid IV(A) lauroyltransferase